MSCVYNLPRELHPVKVVEIQLFNRILAPYVMNLDLNQVNYGIGQGGYQHMDHEHHADG